MLRYVSFTREFLRRNFPVVHETLRLMKHPSEREALKEFERSAPPGHEWEYRELSRAMHRVHTHIQSAHLHSELNEVVKFILDDAVHLEGAVVEAGCFKGGSAAKLSHACKARNRKLHLFDSFCGLPHDEPRQINILGTGSTFWRGGWAGGLSEVKANIGVWGEPEVVEYHEGWFENTMPGFNESVAAAYLDVDLVSSTRTCLKYLFPLVAKGGVIFSQDGHLPLIIDLLEDEAFWEREVGVSRPRMAGLRAKKLVAIHKD